MEIKLDGETADRITALTLAEHRDMCRVSLEEMKAKKQNDSDIGQYVRLIDAMDTLLNEYFERPMI
jgi:hypothetical protein